MNRLPLTPILLLSAAMALPACEDDDAPPTPPINDGDNTIVDPSSTIVASPDLTLQTAVERELTLDPIVSGVDVEVAEGIAKLKGTVKSAYARSRATDIALSVFGIRAADNQLNVPATDLSDEEVADRVRNALLREPATADLDLEVAIDEGRVKLSGEVTSWQEQELAMTIARSRKGVVGVEDDITIDLLEPRAETNIETDVASRLDWDVLVPSTAIEVEVDGSVAHLRGSVRHAITKRRAIADAYVRGVTLVDASEVDVTPWAAVVEREDPSRAFASATEIAQAIHDALDLDPRVSPDAVHAVPSFGVVRLEGEVATRGAKRVAERIALATKGVRLVVNRLDVVAPDKRTDRQVLEAVTAALLGSALVDTTDVKVTIEDHIAHIEGEVPTYFDKARIAGIVSDVVGVVDVENALAVNNPDHRVTLDAFDEGSLAFFERDYFATPARTAGVDSDEELSSAVRSELYWDPHTPLETMKVVVEDGRVTLQGSVTHWWQSSRATTDAYQAGAKQVNNELDILFTGPVRDRSPGAPTLTPQD